MLIEWTQRKLPGQRVRDPEDLGISFVERMVKDGFSHLPDADSCGLEAFLRQCWKNWVSNWRVRVERRLASEIRFSDLGEREDQDDGRADAADAFGSAETPEEALLRRDREARLRAAVGQLNAADRKIFALYFEEELSQGEVGRRLGMKTGTVAWHVHAIRDQLRKRYDAGRG
jgi:RNA polymerase sigma factor (sigma-70 family)